jgi:hypothetical protein
MQALKEKQTSNADECDEWETPFQNDPLIRITEGIFTETVSTIAFTKSTILSMDDDQYRLQSTCLSILV